MKEYKIKENGRILAFLLSGVGDALTCSPLLEEIKRQRPDVNIDVVVMFGAAKSIYQNCPWVDNVFHIDFLKQSPIKSLWQVLKLRFHKYQFNIAALPSNRAVYNILQILAGGKRIGHKYLKNKWVWLNWTRNIAIDEDVSRHVVQQNLDILPRIGLKYPSVEPALFNFSSAEDRQFAQKWLQDSAAGDISQKKVFGIHAGTAIFKNQIKRRWAPEKFAALAQRLVNDGWVGLIFGGPDEDELKQEIIRKSGVNQALLAVNNTTLSQSAAIIEKCSLMISNDSGLMHVASAVQVPTVAIFAFTNPAWVHPWKTEYKLVRQDLACSPCFYYSPAPAMCSQEQRWKCNSNNSVDDAWVACQELINMQSAEK